LSIELDSSPGPKFWIDRIKMIILQFLDLNWHIYEYLGYHQGMDWHCLPKIVKNKYKIKRIFENKNADWPKKK
jgi:hypothetical protein